MTDILLILLFLVFTENLVFVGGTAFPAAVFTKGNSKALLQLSVSVTVISALSSVLTVFVRWRLPDSRPDWLILLISQGIVLVLSVLFSEFLSGLVFGKDSAITGHGKLIFFINTAFVVLSAAKKGLGYRDAALFALAAGIGMYFGSRLLQAVFDTLTDHVPKCFRGFPIRLITASLIGLILFSFFRQ